MNTSTRFLLSAALLGGLALTAQARIERTVEKTFTVSGTGTIRLETQGGGIWIATSDQPVVKITARQKIRAETEAEADTLLKKLELEFEQNGNDVRASAHYEPNSSGFHFGSWPPVNVDFVVTVPANFSAEVRTSGGGIEIGDLSGKVSARTSGGPIKLGKMGAQVEARTSGGGISLGEALGAVDLRTSGGNINVGRVSGSADLSTSGGGIKIDSVMGTVRAHTSGGSVRAGITGPLTEDCVLSTSGGSVRATVDKKAAFRLDASTSGGGVDAEGLTISLEKGSVGRSKLSGSVNGGGPLLKLRSSGGDIVVRTM